MTYFLSLNIQEQKAELVLGAHTHISPICVLCYCGQTYFIPLDVLLLQTYTYYCEVTLLMSLYSFIQ